MKRSLGLFFSFFIVIGSMYGLSNQLVQSIKFKELQKEAERLAKLQKKAEKSLRAYNKACLDAKYSEKDMIVAWDKFVAFGGAWERYTTVYARRYRNIVKLPDRIQEKDEELRKKDEELRKTVLKTKIIEVKYRANRI